MYTTLDTQNITTLDGVLTYVANADTVFIPMLLFAVFIIITISTYFGTKRIRGDGDIFASLLVGSLLASLLALVFTIGSVNIVTLSTLITCVVAFILFLILFFTSRER